MGRTENVELTVLCLIADGRNGRDGGGLQEPYE